MNKTLLYLNGFDPTGATGLFQDIRTTHNHKFYSCGVITCLYHQNTQKIISIYPVPLEQIAQSLDCVVGDIKIHGVKISGIFDVQLSRFLSDFFMDIKEKTKIPIIFDCHFFFQNQNLLVQPNQMVSIINNLEKVSSLIIFNSKEAGVYLNSNLEDINAIRKATSEIARNFKCKSILITGGDFEEKAVDVFYDGTKTSVYETSKQKTENLLGLGDAFSSFILCMLVKGSDIYQAISLAKNYISKTMNHNFIIGKGYHPINLNIPI